MKEVNNPLHPLQMDWNCRLTTSLRFKVIISQIINNCKTITSTLQIHQHYKFMTQKIARMESEAITGQKDLMQNSQEIKKSLLQLKQS